MCRIHVVRYHVTTPCQNLEYYDLYNFSHEDLKPLITIF